jgi:hypothetical protein
MLETSFMATSASLSSWPTQTRTAQMKYLTKISKDTFLVFWTLRGARFMLMIDTSWRLLIQIGLILHSRIPLRKETASCLKRALVPSREEVVVTSSSQIPG